MPCSSVLFYTMVRQAGSGHCPQHTVLLHASAGAACSGKRSGAGCITHGAADGGASSLQVSIAKHAARWVGYCKLQAAATVASAQILCRGVLLASLLNHLPHSFVG